MPEELSLIITALSIGFLHTIMGPDHYVPFVAMAQANDWSTRKSMAVTITCGLAHVMSSVLIGAVGLMVGLLVLSLQRIEALEAFRGETAAWMLLLLGGGYLIFGILRARNHSSQAHHRFCQDEKAPPEDSPVSSHHASGSEGLGWTPWLLFLVFAFGPCEALIPMLMYPAAQSNWVAVVGVVISFAVATLLTMTAAVLIMRLGLRTLPFPDLHRYSHALAGAAIVACGLTIKFGL